MTVVVVLFGLVVLRDEASCDQAEAGGSEALEEAAQQTCCQKHSEIANDLDDGEGLSVADIKYAYKRGPLHIATIGGKNEVCKYLLEDLKLEVNTGDVDGATPLIHATRNGHTETVKYLLEHGADLAIASELGVTVLHHSAAIGNVELLRLFLSKGVDVDAQCYRGTPLIWAAGQDQLDAVRVLLEHHANPNAENDYNVTPLLAARSLACVELLIEVKKFEDISEDEGHLTDFKAEFILKIVKKLTKHNFRCWKTFVVA